MDGEPVLARATVSIEVAIRPCVEADLPALEWMGLYARHRGLIRDAFEAQERGDGLMLLAVSAGFPVGQAWIDFARGRGEGVAWLWAVRVFHPLHGAGIGRRVVDAAEDAIRARGIGSVRLGVERGSPGARRFWERVGYRIVGPLTETFGYVTPEGDAVEETLEQWLMAKDLDAGAVRTDRRSARPR